MLRISLKQFRCWKNLNLNIPLGSITLIKGFSGSGKTTILQAIVWCLYGKIQLVSPLLVKQDAAAKKATSTSVTIELPYCYNLKNGTLTITRSKTPNHLTFQHNNDVYDDKVAQSIIDDLFGTYDIWLASCYIGQGCRNTFLTSPNAGKMEFLNSIAFHEEDPNIYIDKISTILSEKDSIYKHRLSQFCIDVESLNLMMATTDISKSLNVERKLIINNDIITLTQEMTNLKSIKQQRDINIGILNNLYIQLEQLPIINLHNPDNDLSELMIKYEYNDNFDIYNLKNVISKLELRDSFKIILSSNFEIRDFFKTSFSVDDYNLATSQEALYHKNEQLALSIAISYSEVLNTITKNENKLQDHNRLVLERDRLSLEDNILALELEYDNLSKTIILPPIIENIIPIPDYSKYDISLITDKIKNLHNNNNINEIAINPPDLSIIISNINNLENELLTKLEFQNFVAGKYLSDLLILEQNQMILNQKLEHAKLCPVDSFNKIIPDFTKYNTSIIEIELSNLHNKQNMLRSDIQSLQLSEDILSCPCCFNPLRLKQHSKQNILIKAEGSPINPDDIIIKQNELDYISNCIINLNKTIDDMKIQEHNYKFEILRMSEKNKQDHINDINNEIAMVDKNIMIINDKEQQEQIQHELNREKMLKERNDRINRSIQELRFTEQKEKMLYEEQLHKQQLDKQITLNKINTEIMELNQLIQLYVSKEKEERLIYENLVLQEQNRIKSLCEQIKQIENDQRQSTATKELLKQRILVEKRNLSLNKLKLLPELICSQSKILSDEEINDTTILIKQLQNIIITDLPKYSSNYIKECLNHQEQKRHYDNLILEIPSIWRHENIIDVKNYMIKLDAYISMLTISKNNKIRIDSMKENINDQILIIKNKICDDPQIRIDAITKKIEEYMKDLSISDDADKIINRRNLMITERENLTKMNMSLANLQMLKQCALETECKNLQDVVGSINSSIEEVCETLFDRDINIKLNMFKTIQSTKNVKPKVNFMISYQGGTFDNINQMSGGEGDRASIALTVALNRLSSFPILMLDESLAALDLDMKEATVETISQILVNTKKEAGTKTIIIIMHDGIEGIFDNVIDINSMNTERY